jgi:hypothetical protein
MQNQNEWNSKEFNSYFSPKGKIVAKQIATKEQLLKQQSSLNSRDAGGSGITGLLVQDSISETPKNFRQTNVQNITSSTVEKKFYVELYYCMSKVVNYLRMHKNGQFLATGNFAQSIINTPKLQAIRSRTNASDDLSKLYSMQFYLNTGPTGNKFLLELSEPLPGAVDEKEFIRRLDPAAAEAEFSRNLARMGFVDTDQNPLTADTAPIEAIRTLSLSPITPLESVCKGRNV